MDDAIYALGIELPNVREGAERVATSAVAPDDRAVGADPLVRAQFHKSGGVTLTVKTLEFRHGVGKDEESVSVEHSVAVGAGSLKSAERLIRVELRKSPILHALVLEAARGVA